LVLNGWFIILFDPINCPAAWRHTA